MVQLRAIVRDQKQNCVRTNTQRVGTYTLLIVYRVGGRVALAMHTRQSGSKEDALLFVTQANVPNLKLAEG